MYIFPYDVNTLDRYITIYVANQKGDGTEIYMKKIFILLPLIAVIFILYTNNTTPEGSTNYQEDIANRILRFHVVANSDSEEDQALKIKIKDAVVEYMSPLLKDSDSLDTSIHIAKANFNSIESIAKKIIAENDYNYDVSCNIEDTVFPVKCYGDVVLPSGKYTALNIKIGKAKGKNWWCILYPPLCFVDASSGVVPESSKKQLQETLTEEEYRSILDEPEKVTIRFKYLKFLNNIF